jgi:hypothetical protein
MQIIIAAEAEAKPLSEHHYLVSFLTLLDTSKRLFLRFYSAILNSFLLMFTATSRKN